MTAWYSEASIVAADHEEFLFIIFRISWGIYLGRKSITFFLPPKLLYASIIGLPVRLYSLLGYLPEEMSYEGVRFG